MVECVETAGGTMVWVLALYFFVPQTPLFLLGKATVYLTSAFEGQVNYMYGRKHGFRTDALYVVIRRTFVSAV